MLVSFEHLFALCQNARISVNVPVVNMTAPGVQAVESSDIVNAACCESTAMRKFVYKETVAVIWHGTASSIAVLFNTDLASAMILSRNHAISALFRPVSSC